LSGNKIHDVSTVGTFLRGVATGIEFVGNKFTPIPVCALWGSETRCGVLTSADQRS
jgi:hypothetical protein